MKNLFLFLFIIISIQSWSANRYWVGGGSSTDWNATGNTNWGTASGVKDNASIPTSSDDVYFDANSPTTTVTTSATMNCKTLTTNGWAGTVSFGSNYLRVYGDVSFVGMTGTFSCYFQTYANINFDGQGKSVSRINTLNGNFTMTSNLVVSNSILNYKTFDTNGYNLNAASAELSLYSSNAIFYARTGTHFIESITASSTAVKGTFDFGSSSTSLASLTPINSNAINCTLVCGTSTIKFNSTSGITTVTLLGKTYYNLEFNNNGQKDITGGGAIVTNTLFGGTSGTISILDNNNWGALTIDAGKTITTTAGKTNTVTSITANGTPASKITLQSATAGSTWALVGSANSNLKNCDIKDCAASGHNFLSTDCNDKGNNTGIIFSNLLFNF